MTTPINRTFPRWWPLYRDSTVVYLLTFYWIFSEERKPTVQDIANQKGIVHRVSGWRVHHVAAQMDDLSSVEQQVLQKLFEFRENLPKPRPGQKSKYHDELMMLDELVQVSYHYPCGMALITGSTSTTNVSLLVIV